MKIILIAVMATNRVIGKDNKLPWHIPEELRFFKKTTMGYPVIMGRRTYESIGTPLPGRQNIVVTRNPDYTVDGAVTASSLEEAVAMAKSDEKAFILGGYWVFKQSLRIADHIILSVLDREVEGDICFPDFSDEEWQETDHERYDSGSEPFTVHYYQKIQPAA